jgi:hypothetical protein
MRTVNSVLFFLSLVVGITAFWNRNDIPVGVQLVAALQQPPRQQAIEKSPFVVDYHGVSYEVDPRYAYELDGMLVSYRHHDGESTMHRLSNDHLNMADFCVVWGNTAANPLLQKINFWNGIFTCNVSTRDQQAWDSFNMEELSNNHLISADDAIRRAITSVKVGDQIRVKGWLAHYGAAGQPKRGTSVTRTDQGNGACETIFVTDFQLLAAAVNPWRITMYAALCLWLLSIVVHFSLPYRVRG